MWSLRARGDHRLLDVDGRRLRNFREAERQGFGQTRLMKIKLTSIMVDDQSKALKFYTEVFGFVKKHDIPVGPGRGAGAGSLVAW